MTYLLSPGQSDGNRESEMLGDVRGDVRVPPFLPARSFVASTGFPGLSTLKSTQQGWMDGLTSSREHDNIIYHDIS